MVAIFQSDLTAAEVKARARELGADLVGIADGRVMDAHPPDGDDPRRPSDITAHDGGRCIVLAKRLNAGAARIPRWDERHKYYNDELCLTLLEECSLELVYWLEDQGFPALIVPPVHVEPRRYGGQPGEHLKPMLSLSHAAVEAGLGTLGLNLQLLTPEFGPRVMLTAVLSSLPVEPDQRLGQALCHGPACGRCLLSCPGDAVGHWQRDWPACDRFRSPHGFKALSDHVVGIINEPDPAQQAELIRSESTFDLWQSILRGAGVITGCRRCQDVCPVGADADGLLGDVLDEIAEAKPEKEARRAALAAAGPEPETYRSQGRWIGTLEENRRGSK
jgi:ferredoxin